MRGNQGESQVEPGAVQFCSKEIPGHLHSFANMFQSKICTGQSLIGKEDFIQGCCSRGERSELKSELNSGETKCGRDFNSWGMERS